MTDAMSTDSKIPSRKARITAEVTRRLSGLPPRSCIGCAFLYTVPHKDNNWTNWIGCAQDHLPRPFSAGASYDPPNCPAPWYPHGFLGYTYLGQDGEIRAMQYPRVGELAKKNARKYFEFGHNYPRLRSEVDPSNS
jgi:hypothetical protein